MLTDNNYFLVDSDIEINSDEKDSKAEYQSLNMEKDDY